jgi:hypothetical protein
VVPDDSAVYGKAAWDTVDFDPYAAPATSTGIASDVWAATTRSLTDRAGFTLTTGERAAIRQEIDANSAKLDVAVSSRAAPGAAMALTSAERTSVRANLALEATVASRAAPGDAMALTTAERNAVRSGLALEATVAARATQVSVDNLGAPAQASDSRFAYLDAPVSSAGGDSVWNTTQRDQVLTNLDAKVTSRAVAGDAMTLTTNERNSVRSGLAQEATVASRATQTSVNNLGAPAQANDPRLANLDVPVSSVAGGGEGVWSATQRDQVLTDAAAAKSASQSADGKLTTARLAAVDRIPASPAKEGSPVTLVQAEKDAIRSGLALEATVASRAAPGAAMTLTAAQVTALADAFLSRSLYGGKDAGAGEASVGQALALTGAVKATIVGSGNSRQLLIFREDGATEWFRLNLSLAERASVVGTQRA